MLVACAALPIAAMSADDPSCSSQQTTDTQPAPGECQSTTGQSTTETTTTEQTTTEAPPPPPPPPPTETAPRAPTTTAPPPPPPAAPRPHSRPRKCRKTRRQLAPKPGDKLRRKRCRTRHRARRRHHSDERRQARRRHAVKPRSKRPDLRRASRRRLVPITRLARPLPDPLPPGKRLDAGFVRSLKRISAEQHASWALVLAVLRERGSTGAAPADPGTLRKVASEAAAGKLRAGERVTALADYNRAVGLDGLVRGLAAVKRQLGDRVLNDSTISLYPGGRGDVAGGRIDVRVLVLMRYLAERHHGITVTSLIAGHSIYTKSGGLSLHPFGRAVDIAAVGGVSVLGHQQPGGVTERALRSVLLLPGELRPSELISLFALGGPSFALPDHADHIHVGY